MDPNATLESLRAALAEPENVDGEIVAELFAALDEWLTRGGFLPVDWATRGVAPLRGENYGTAL